MAIKQGTSASILGENGAGKTLLFNGTLGLQRPFQGEIRIFGEKIHYPQRLTKMIFSQVAWVTASAEDIQDLSTTRQMTCTLALI